MCEDPRGKPEGIVEETVGQEREPTAAEADEIAPGPVSQTAQPVGTYLKLLRSLARF